MKRMKLYVLALVALLFGCNETDKFDELTLPGTIEFEHETYYVPENIGETRIPVLLSTVVSKDVKLIITIANRQDLLEKPDQIAKEDVHFKLPSKELIIPKGETYGYFPLTVIDDIIVNENRMFDVKIESISDGVQAASISQVCRVIIKNDDFWPEVSFGKKQFNIVGSESLLVLPLNVEGGIIRTPFDVTVVVESLGATEGTDFSLRKKKFTFTEENRKDSIMIDLTAPEDMVGDMNFKLRYVVNEAGRTGAIPETEVVIKKVVKYVGFSKRINWMYEGYTKVKVPIAFTGLRSSKDVTAKIRVKSVEGINMEDVELPTEYITTKGDTVEYFEFNLKTSIMGNDAAAVELEVEEVVDGMLGVITSAWVRVRQGDEQDKADWGILGFSSEEAKNDGPAYAYRLIDGKRGTASGEFWHTVWSSSGATLPAWISVEFGKIIDVESVTVYRRGNYARRVEILFASDPDMKDFIKYGEIEFASSPSNGNLTFYLPEQVNAYAVKLNFPNSGSGANIAISELDVFGKVVK